MADEAELRGRKKAAAFMLALDSETAAVLLTKMNEREVQLLSEEMTRMGQVSGGDMERTLKDFQKKSGADKIAVEPMVQAILEKALGKEKAKDLLEKIRRQSRDNAPFRSLAPLDAKQVASLLRGEHPQVISLVIAHLEPPIGSALLKDMPDDLRYEVIKRIAQTQELPTELVRQVDEMMEVRAFSLSKSAAADDGKGRFKTVAQMLNVTEPSVSKAVLDKLNREAPAIANEIQALMFVFEDLVKIADKDMQKVLGEIDKGDLTLALRAAPPEVRDKMLNNLSARARESMKEEIEMMGPKPLAEVEEAQKRILQAVRAMEERGDIQVSRGTQERMV
jgi:flagellar motor switch protein FliG